MHLTVNSVEILNAQNPEEEEEAPNEEEENGDDIVVWTEGWLFLVIFNGLTLLGSSHLAREPETNPEIDVLFGRILALRSYLKFLKTECYISHFPSRPVPYL